MKFVNCANCSIKIQTDVKSTAMNACSAPINIVIGSNKICLTCINCFTVTDSNLMPDSSDPEPLRPIS